MECSGRDNNVMYRDRRPETNEPPANHKTRNNEAVFDGWRGTGSLVSGLSFPTTPPHRSFFPLRLSFATLGRREEEYER